MLSLLSRGASFRFPAAKINQAFFFLIDLLHYLLRKQYTFPHFLSPLVRPKRYCEKDTPGSAREKPISLSAGFCFNIIYLCTWHHNSVLVHACVHTPAPEAHWQGAACSLVITNNAHSKTHLRVLFWGSVSCSMAFWHLHCRGASQTIKLAPELEPTHFKLRHQKMFSSPCGKNLDLLCNCLLTLTHQSLTFSCSTRLSEGSTALFKPDPSTVRAGKLAGLGSVAWGVSIMNVCLWI